MRGIYTPAGDCWLPIFCLGLASRTGDIELRCRGMSSHLLIFSSLPFGLSFFVILWVCFVAVADHTSLTTAVSGHVRKKNKKTIKRTAVYPGQHPGQVHPVGTLHRCHPVGTLHRVHPVGTLHSCHIDRVTTGSTLWATLCREPNGHVCNVTTPFLRH